MKSVVDYFSILVNQVIKKVKVVNQTELNIEWNVPNDSLFNLTRYKIIISPYFDKFIWPGLNFFLKKFEILN